MRRPATWWQAIISAPIAAGLLVCAPSCESFSASNASNGVSDAMNDVSDAMTDAPAPDDGAPKDAAATPTDSAGTDAGLNLFALGSFELGGCTGNSYHSSLTPDPTAHGGLKSCRVCSDGTSPDVFSFDSDVDGVTPLIGARYLAEAWIRNAPGAGAPASGVELTLRTHTAAAVAQDIMFTMPRRALTSTWQKLTIELDVVTAGIPKLAVVLDGQNEGGTCFLVDDIVVLQEK